MFCCLRTCLNDPNNAHNIPLIQENPICLDTSHMGHEVVVIKGGTRACGSGCCLATAPLVQSKSYFEVKIQQAGQWSVGLATRQTNFNNTKGGQDKESWCLCSDATVCHNAGIVHQLEEKTNPTTTENVVDMENATILNSTGIPQEGDTIGVSFDHIELNFYLNGKKLEVPVHHVKGAIYPAVWVDDGAILDVVLDNFTYTPPPGFDRIMIEQSLL
ncbi:SPRY domain-containing protein 7 [Culicoides brevitarsis]|uniref:SPRY domain-containing protein 7 n=1 Tax=Culicoides brevitarsis TaxID=469753 RepID=UPI00307B3944